MNCDETRTELNDKIDTLDRNTNIQIKTLAKSLEVQRADLMAHVDQSNKMHMAVQGELKVMRQQHTDVVKEVSSAVVGLNSIAEKVTHFYTEFVRDREEQKESISKNNTFRDRMLGGVGVVALIGTLTTIAINIDKIKGFF